MRQLVIYAQKGKNSYGIYEIYRYTCRDGQWYIAHPKKKKIGSDDFYWKEYASGYSSDQILYILNNNYLVYSIDEINNEHEEYAFGESFAFVDSLVRLFFDINKLLNYYSNGNKNEILRYINKNEITYPMLRHILWDGDHKDKKLLHDMVDVYVTPDDIFLRYNGLIPEGVSDSLHDANIRMLDKLFLEEKKIFLINSWGSDVKVFEYTGQRLYNFCCNLYTINEELVNSVPTDRYELAVWFDEHKEELKPIYWV